MTEHQFPEQMLMAEILAPLLADFSYWFGRSLRLLEEERLAFLSPESQAAVLARVKQASQEVAAANLMFQATGGHAGVDPRVMMQWHQLVQECWQIAMYWRSQQKAIQSSPGEVQ
jgi:hypothetical protein